MSKASKLCILTLFKQMILQQCRKMYQFSKLSFSAELHAEFSVQLYVLLPKDLLFKSSQNFSVTLQVGLIFRRTGHSIVFGSSRSEYSVGSIPSRVQRDGIFRLDCVLKNYFILETQSVIRCLYVKTCFGTAPHCSDSHNHREKQVSFDLPRVHLSRHAYV